MCCQNTVRTSPLYCCHFITASSRPVSTLSDPCHSHLHAQLKCCQDITSQSLVCHGFLVNASCPRITQPLLRYPFSPPCHQCVSNVSPVRLQCLTRACWAYPQFTTPVLSSTVRAWLSPRQYVTDSSLKPPLDLRILSNLAKTLSQRCQSTVKPRQNTVTTLSEYCQTSPKHCHNAAPTLS